MKTVRHSVFETNSSSSHSITISKDNVDGLYESIIPDDDGNITLFGGEYGWQWERFNDALTKANYCAVDSLHNLVHLEMLSEVICEHTGAKQVIISATTSNYNNGVYLDGNSYIDHDSEGVANEAFNSKSELKEFLFNPRSWLFLGNDNDEVPSGFYDVNTDISYKFAVKIDGTNSVERFRHYPDENELKKSLKKILSYLFYEDDFYEKMSLRDANGVSAFVDYEFGDNIRGTGKSSFYKIKDNVVIVFLQTAENSILNNDIWAEKELKFSVEKIT